MKNTNTPHYVQTIQTMDNFLTSEFNKSTDVNVIRRSLLGDYNGLAQKIAVYISLEKHDAGEFTLDTFRELVSNITLLHGESVAAKEIEKDLSLFSKHMPYLFIEGTHYGIDEGFSHWHHDDGDEENNIFTRFLCSYNRPSTLFMDEESTIKVDKHRFHQIDGTLHWNANIHDITKHRLALPNRIGSIHKRPDTSDYCVPGLLLNA